MANDPLSYHATPEQVAAMQAGMIGRGYKFTAADEEAKAAGEIGTFELGHGYTLAASYDPAAQTLALQVSAGIFHRHAKEEVDEHAREFLGVQS